MTTYRIESWGHRDDPGPGRRRREWSDKNCGDVTEFTTKADALAAIASLRDLGGEWADAKYRIVAEGER